VNDLRIMREAFRIAHRPAGPCSWTSPRDIQEAEADPLLPRGPGGERPRARTRPVAKAVQLLKASEADRLRGRRRGHGERHRGVPRLHGSDPIPTVHTLKGLGTLPYNDPLFLGMLGMHGFKQSNLRCRSATC
jgi:acetolactate synthase-1/2/3 large subunit